jgi:hypothetical protein
MRKFLRGVEQVKELRTEAHAFENDNAYVFREEVEPRTPQHRIHRIYACERKPMAEHWPRDAAQLLHAVAGLLRLLLDRPGIGGRRGIAIASGVASAIMAVQVDQNMVEGHSPPTRDAAARRASLRLMIRLASRCRRCT